MIFESAYVRITTSYGVGTLWLGFPGAPVNALDWTRLKELDSALAAVESNPVLHSLVVRSAKPAGFCAGLHPGVADVTDRAAFAAFGQRVFTRLAMLPFTTIAFIDGPCLGAGLELALACDHRLCVATDRTLLGFPDRFTCLGGGPRLRKHIGRSARRFIESGRTLSGREARALGVVDRAFCARRAKIELRTFLDELERSPQVPMRECDDCGFAEERRVFAAITSPLAGEVGGASQPGGGSSGLNRRDVSPPTRLASLGDLPLKGGGQRQDPARCALQPPPQKGSSTAPPTDIATLLARGFITPLEAEQMRAAAATAPSATSPEAIPLRRAA